MSINGQRPPLISKKSENKGDPTVQYTPVFVNCCSRRVPRSALLNARIACQFPVDVHNAVALKFELSSQRIASYIFGM